MIPAHRKIAYGSLIKIVLDKNMFFRVFLPLLLLATAVVYTTISYDLWYELGKNQACPTKQSNSVEDQIEPPGSASNYYNEKMDRNYREYMYSWHRCIGDTIGKHPCKFRSCMFQNVCYDGNSEGVLTYYAHPKNDISHESEVSSGTMVPYERMTRTIFGKIVRSDHRSSVREFKMNIVRGSIPVEKVYWAHDKAHSLAKSPKRKIVTVLNDYFIPETWSHLLMDNIFPIYRLLSMFGFKEAIVEPLHFSNPCSVKCHECDFNEKNVAKWMHLLNGGKFQLQRLQEKYSFASKNNSICFPLVASGLSLFSDHGLGSSHHGRHLEFPDWNLWGISEPVWSFRELTFKRMGLDPKLSFSNKLHDVVLWQKGSQSVNPGIGVSRWFLEIRRYLDTEGCGMGAKVPCSVSTMTMEKLRIREQMQHIGSTKVAISEVGSTSYGAIWLPRGATLILLHMPGAKYDYYFWSNIAYITVRFVEIPSKSATHASRQEFIERVCQAVLSGIYRFEQRSLKY